MGRDWGLKRRDVAISTITGSCLLLQSVDASAGIGGIELDVLRADPGEVGYWVTRAACFELIALGAEVLTLSLGVTQREQIGAVVSGARRFCAEAELSPSFIDSSENYVSPLQSAICVSAAGTVSLSDIVFRPLVPDVLICTVGSAFEAQPDPTAAISVWDVQRVISHPQTREVIPVGSRGVMQDLEDLGVIYELTTDADWLNLPGGPGQLFLVLCDDSIEVASFQHIGRILP